MDVVFVRSPVSKTRPILFYSIFEENNSNWGDKQKLFELANNTG
jgi:hypothetical protein